MTRRLEAALCAARWLGTKEGTKEHREILEVYNGIRPLPRGYRMTQSDPWCAAFVSAAAVMAGVGDLVPLECGCGRMIEKARAMGIWVEDDGLVPQIGDWVLYDWQAGKSGDCQGSPDHVGIVIGLQGQTILVAEGNYDNMVKLRKIPVNYEKIRGFVCPRYEQEEHMGFHTVEQVPEFARATIEKLVADGSLMGITEDDLGLSEELIRILVILDRRGKL